MDYYENTGGQSINIQWAGPGVANQTIPNTSLGRDPITATPAGPATGNFAGNMDVTLTCATAGATIFYTVDGSAPDPRSANGSGPTGLTFNITATTRVRAMAVAPGFLPGGDYYDVTLTRTDGAAAVNAAIQSAVPMGVNDKLEVNFNRTVIDPSASVAGNYTLGAGTVSAAALQPRNADLKVWLKLDEAVTPSLDSSPVGTNTGAWNGPPAADGTNFATLDFANNTSLNFVAGESDYVEIADAPSLQFGGTNGFSVSFWIRLGDTTQARRLINKYDPTAPDKGWLIDVNAAADGSFVAGAIRFRVDDGANNVQMTAGGLTLNVWHHVVCRFDRQTSRIAIIRNGTRTQADVNFNNFGSVDSTRPIVIGRLESPIGTVSGNYFTGQLDDLRIYGVALSDAEVTGLQNGALDPSTRVVLTTSALAPDVANTVTSSGLVDATGATSGISTANFMYRTGTFSYERYLVAGGATYDMTRSAVFPNSPSYGTLLNVAELDQTPNATSTVDIDDFGARLRGYFIPNQSGPWIFSIASDDNGTLFLSPDEDPARRRRVALQTAWSPFKEHADAESLQSGPNLGADNNNLGLTITLVAGQRYYMEAFMKEGGGGDNLAVAAKFDDGTGPIVNGAASIPTAQMAPYIEGLALTSIPLKSRVVMVGQTVTYTVTTTGSGASYQWRRNGVNLADGGVIAGSQTATLVLTGVTSANDGTYDVVITGLGGTLTSNSCTLTIFTPPTPTVTSIVPVSGPDSGGQVVRITGTGFTYGLTNIELDTTVAANPFWTVDGTTIFAQTPRHAPGVVGTTARIATQSNTLAASYTYYGLPAFAAVNPIVNPVGDSGAPTGVTINGSNFTPGTTVSFGLLQATAIVVAPNGQSLTCLAPAQAAGPVDVKITTPVGEATLTSGFRYYDDPTLAALNPIVPINGPDNGGPPVGFLAITITGTNFAQNYTTVTFGAFGTVNATVNGAGDSLTVIPPAATLGVTTTVDVTINAPGGSILAPGAYTYRPDPTLSPLTVNSGFDQGTQNITLDGSFFVDTFTTVFFGLTQGTVVSVAPNGLSLVVTTPAGTAGTAVAVTVNTPGGTATLPAAFTYYADPTITPGGVINTDNLSYGSNGRAIGGNNVSISGTNLLGAISVKFNNVDASSFTVVNASTINAVTPAGTGTVVVEVVTPGGPATGSWTYHAAPTVISVDTPSNTGSTQGGETRTVNGTNLPATLTAISFGGVPATGVTASGASAIVTTPAHAAGQVNVEAVTPGGTGTLVNGFTYTGPFISGVAPNVGPVIGGQTVVISGSGLSGATSVTIGGATATITGNTAGTITVTSPAGTEGPAVPVFVETPSGMFTLNGAYSYTGTPTIISVTPNKGPTVGGQSVQIIGTNFASGFTEVRIGGVLATGVSVTGTSQIDLLTPPGTAGAPVNVVVTTYTNQNSAPSSYEYFAAPTLGTMVPNRGPMAGGQVVSITGTNFVDLFTEVLFNGVPVTPSGVTSSSLTVTTPLSLTATTVNVAVRTFGPSGQTTSTLPYTYVNQATAVDLSLTKTVNNGSAGVGQNVTFTITLSNTGAVAGSGVTVTDLLPAALSYVTHNAGVGTYTPGTGVWNVGAIAVSGNAVLTITATVNSSVSVTNVAEVTAATQEDVDSVPSNGSLTEDDRATASVDAGLAIQTPALLHDGTAEAFYYATITALGGNAPYTWSVLSSTPAFPFNLDPATGVISGFAPTVAVPTDYVFTVQVSDAASTPQTNSRQFTITIDPQNVAAPVINAVPAAPAAVVGQPYFFAFTATGGNAPYVWSSTALPAGLALNPSTGVLAGAPTTAGTPSFSVTATSSTGASVALVVNLTIAVNPVTITTTSLPNGTVGAPYTHYVEVAGGVGPFTWTVSGGALPAWMSMTTTGRRITVSGTPNNTTAATFTLQAADGGQTINDTQAFAFTVAAAGGAITIGTPANGLPDGTVSAPYSASLSANGGTPPYFWSIVGGSLPPGLFLNGGSGFIGSNTGSGPGTPTAAGVYTFTVQAALFGGGATPGTADLTITIAPTPTLTTPLTLPGGASGTAYFAELTFAGGTQPVTWTLTGTLPTGITLNGTAGVLSGTPTVNGTFGFTLTATDANGAAVSGLFSLTLANGAGLVVASTLPRGTVGVPYSGSLTAAGGTPPYTWSIVSGTLPGWATFNPATGTVSGTPTAASTTAMNFQVTGGGTATSGVFNFIIDGNLAITTATLPAAGVTSPYGATLSASGGTGALVWDLVSGSLPGGVTLSPTGSLGGTVSATAVTTSFQVRVTDSLGRTATRGYTITVGPALPSGGGGSSGGGGCGGSIGLSTMPFGALASLAALLGLARRRRK